MLSTKKCIGLILLTAAAQVASADTELQLPLDRTAQVAARNVVVRTAYQPGRPTLEIRRIVPGAPADSYVLSLAAGQDFGDGTIEVDVAGNVPGEWSSVRIEIKGATARLVVRPAVEQGSSRSDVEHFRNLRIRKAS
jgi:hypothetical protein